MADKVTVTTSINPTAPIEVGPQEAADLRWMGLLVEPPAAEPAPAPEPPKTGGKTAAKTGPEAGDNPTGQQD